MPIEVELPGGEIAEFPDDMPRDAIQAALQRQFPKVEPGRDAVTQLGAGLARGAANTVDLVTRGVTKLVAQNPVSMLVGDDQSRKLLGEVVDQSLDEISARKAVDRRLPTPATTAGRYAGSAGEMIGGAILPQLGFYAAAPSIARGAVTAPAQSWLGRMVQSGAEQAVANPVRTVAMDVAGAGAAGVARQAAEDQGYGLIGQTAAAIGGGLVPGIAASYGTAARGTQTPIGSPTAQSVARQRQIAHEADVAAFDDLGIRPFGPAFNQGPVASVGKQLTETPLVGAVLRNNLDETYHDMAAAGRRLADNISPNATPETAGVALQQGLERFRNTRLSGLPAQTVEDLGVPSTVQVAPRTVMSQGAQAVANQAAPIRQAIGANTAQTTRGVTVPSARPQSQFMSVRTTPENLTDSELATIVRAPAAATSVATRAEALYERAWRMLPDMLRSNNTARPQMFAPVNTRRALDSIDASIANQISGQNTLGGALVDRLRNPSSNITLGDLRAVRTEVGRALGNYSPMAPGALDRTQLKQLYGALSRDIEVALETTANRAAVGTQAQGPARVTVEAARQAAGALHAMRTADRYFRSSLERMDRVAQVLNAQTPEAAARRMVQGMVDGIKGDARLVRTAMSGLRPEERAQFGAMVVRELGRPIPSARGIVQEADFSAQSFVTRWRQMSPEARRLVFTPAHEREIENLFRVANRVANVEALANTSRSATNAINLTGGAGVVGSLVRGDVATPLAIGGSGLAASLLMSRPIYTRWMTHWVRMRAAVRDGSDASLAPLLRHLGALERGARLHPEMWPAYYAAAQEAEAIKERNGSGRSTRPRPRRRDEEEVSRPPWSGRGPGGP